MKNFTNITTGISVSNFEKSLEWYKTWLGEPSEIPMKGLAEWEILPNALIGVGQSEDENFQKSDVIIGVKNLYEYTEELKSLGVKVGEIMDYGFVFCATILDPDGNKITFAEEKK
ncbi:MAG: VOC family protein [Candidatus Altimarinota bacterium]